jgi:hypothetical protein
MFAGGNNLDQCDRAHLGEHHRETWRPRLSLLRVWWNLCGSSKTEKCRDDDDGDDGDDGTKQRKDALLYIMKAG